MVFVKGSITGVPVTPTEGYMGVPVELPLTLCGVPSEVDQSADVLSPSASKAYTVSFWVATKTALCCPPLMARFGT